MGTKYRSKYSWVWDVKRAYLTWRLNEREIKLRSSPADNPDINIYIGSEVFTMEKLVYTVQETAEILNIGMNKAYELIQQNKFHLYELEEKF